MTSPDLPALLGGRPVRPQGPPSWPLPDEAVLAALLAAFHDGSWGQYNGPHVARLEEELAARFGGTAVTCASGTLAVEVGLRALKVGPGDEVILAAYDYGGNFLSVHAVGARPVLVDVAPGDWNLASQRLAAAVCPATRAILASHLHGGVVPMAELSAVAAGHGLKVLEDAAQQPGAVIQGRPAGTWGDVGVLSFGGSKLLSAGRGGALISRHPEVAQRARLWLGRGNNRLAPLSELQAAVLLPQLARLDERNRRRAEAVARLRSRLGHVPGLRSFMVPYPDTNPGYYKLGWQYDADRFGLPRDRFVAALRAEGVAMEAGFAALHVGRSPGRFRMAGALGEAERAHREAVVLHHPVLLGGEGAVEEVAAAVEKVHRHAAEILARKDDEKRAR